MDGDGGFDPAENRQTLFTNFRDTTLGESKHRYDADHAKQILLRYLEKHGGETQTDG